MPRLVGLGKCVSASNRSFAAVTPSNARGGQKYTRTKVFGAPAVMGEYRNGRISHH
jgi:hypothetical protein